MAETEHTSPKSLANALREHDEYPPFEWMTKSKRIFSFHDLDEYPWKEICDVGTIDPIDTDHFALSDDEDLQRDFVQLLNQALRAKVSRTLSYNRKYNCHYFKPSKKNIEREYWYESFHNRTKQDVVKGYGERKDGAGPTNYRHSAFNPQFLRFGDTWYLAVQPTYYFTRDGAAAYKYAAERLRGIKALENNYAYLGQFQMWSHFLTRRQQRNFFDDEEYSFLAFEALEEFSLEVGIADELWRNSEDSEKATAFSEANQEGLLL